MTKKTTIRGKQQKTDAKTATTQRTREDMYQELSSDADTAGQQVYEIMREDGPVNMRSFLPDYRYRFQGAQTHSGDAFLGEFAQFLDANAYLVLDDHPTREFADGFARAAAIAALFMDSLDIAGEQHTK